MDPDLVQLASTARTAVFAAGITNVSDVDALTLTFAASSLDAKSLLELGYDGGLRAAALDARKRLIISDDDFVRAFGCFARGHRLSPSRELVSLAMTRPFTALVERMEAALATTLSEGAQKKLWKNHAPVRAAAIVALLRESDCNECLASVLGGLVVSDVRMVEELRTELEDEDIDLSLVLDTITALSSTIV